MSPPVLGTVGEDDDDQHASAREGESGGRSVERAAKEGMGGFSKDDAPKGMESKE